MATRTSIEWTDMSWNPVSGCSRVSPGCEHCYAERLSLRLGFTKRPWTGPNAAENVVYHEDRLDQPRHWKKPRRIFVNSMSDLFHEQVPFHFIDEIFYVMRATPQHTYQVLTKRPARMLEWARSTNARHDDILRACPNVWFLVSAEDQRRLDERVPLLLQMPAAVRGVSLEPLLGPIDLASWHNGNYLRTVGRDGAAERAGLDWVIVGGESGPGARPCNLAWIRSVRDQCQAARVPLFVKQIGSKPWWDGIGPGPGCPGPSSPGMGVLVHEAVLDGRLGWRLDVRDRKGGDPRQWPEDLRIREWPQTAAGGRG